MDFRTLIERRQSCRSFDTRPVERGQLTACARAGRLAPSACNSQPWRFIVVDEPALVGMVQNGIFTLTGRFNRFVTQAPAFIVLAEQKPNKKETLGEIVKNQDFTQMDLGIAAAHIVLQAEDLGLGSCIIGWFSEKKLKQALGMHADLRIRLVIALGYPKDGVIRPKQRKDEQEVITYNHY